MFLVRDFSWQRGVDHFGAEAPRTHISELPRGFAYVTPYLLGRPSDRALIYPPASSLHFTTSCDSCHAADLFARLVVSAGLMIQRSLRPSLPRFAQKSLAGSSPTGDSRSRRATKRKKLNGHRWLPNMNGMAIAYASQPRLRTRLTLRRLT